MKKVKITSIFVLTALLFFVYVSSTQAAGENSAIANYVEEFRVSTKATSVSVVVVSADGMEVYGDETGLYQIGSMTKAFTGLAIQKLIYDGLLSGEDEISKWLPGFTTCYDSDPCEITIEQLLEMTSGYTNQEAEYPSAASGMSLMDWTESISGRELHSKPGAEYAYSNVNYNLLGAVIESVTGMEYGEYLENEILIPLGLTNTYVHVPEKLSVIPGSRLGFRHGFTYEIPVIEGRIPAGYFYSNATDMARWIQIWMGTLEVPEEYEELVRIVKSRLQNTGDYASGWELFEDGIMGHSGGTPNYSSRIEFSDVTGIGTCVLTNLNVAASTDGLCHGIYSIAAGVRPGNLPMDVWTVFDLIFTVVSIMAGMMLLFVARVKQRNFLFWLEGYLVILFMATCIVMPLVFGAPLREIAFTWAPYSFMGGLLLMAVNILVIGIRLWKLRKHEN